MNKIIAVDFDGTLCKNKWPEIGEPNSKLIEYLVEEQKQGTKIILWTCRCGNYLENAIDWCKEHSLYFDAVNRNLDEHLESFESDSRKIFAHVYIDDRAMTPFW